MSDNNDINNEDINSNEEYSKNEEIDYNVELVGNDGNLSEDELKDIKNNLSQNKDNESVEDLFDEEDAALKELLGENEDEDPLDDSMITDIVDEEEEEERHLEELLGEEREVVDELDESLSEEDIKKVNLDSDIDSINDSLEYSNFIDKSGNNDIGRLADDSINKGLKDLDNSDKELPDDSRENINNGDENKDSDLENTKNIEESSEENKTDNKNKKTELDDKKDNKSGKKPFNSDKDPNKKDKKSENKENNSYSNKKRSISSTAASSATVSSAKGKKSPFADPALPDDGNKNFASPFNNKKVDEASNNEDINKSSDDNDDSPIPKKIVGVGKAGGIASPFDNKADSFMEDHKKVTSRSMFSKREEENEEPEDDSDDQKSPPQITGSFSSKKAASIAVLLLPLVMIMTMMSFMNVSNTNHRSGLCSSGSEVTASDVSASAGKRGVPEGEFSKPEGKESVITSGWMDPTRGKHKGIDFAYPGDPGYSPGEGKPIYAFYDGVVTTVQKTNTVPYTGYGTMVIISHEKDGKKWDTWYAHEWPEDIMVKEGQEVKAGQQIGKQGTNGDSSAPHLHFEIHPDGGDAVDPAPWVEKAKFPDESGSNDSGSVNANKAAETNVLNTVNANQISDNKKIYTVQPVMENNTTSETEVTNDVSKLYEGDKYVPHVTEGGATKVIHGMGVKQVNGLWLSTQNRKQEMTDIQGHQVNGYEGATPAAQKLIQILIDEFGDEPGAGWISAWRHGDPSAPDTVGDVSPDHPDGRAVDFGVTGDQAGLELGNKINKFVLENAEALGVAHTIWASDKGVDYRWEMPGTTYENGFSINTNGHRDHVHISITGADISDDWKNGARARNANKSGENSLVCCADQPNQAYTKNGDAVDTDDAAVTNQNLIYAVAEAIHWDNSKIKDEVRRLAVIIAASQNGLMNVANDGSDNGRVPSSELADSLAASDKDVVGSTGDRVGLFNLPIGDEWSQNSSDLANIPYSAAKIMWKLKDVKNWDNYRKMYKDLGYTDDLIPDDKKWTELVNKANSDNLQLSWGEDKGYEYKGELGLTQQQWNDIKRALPEDNNGDVIYPYKGNAASIGEDNAHATETKATLSGEELQIDMKSQNINNSSNSIFNAQQEDETVVTREVTPIAGRGAVDSPTPEFGNGSPYNKDDYNKWKALKGVYGDDLPSAWDWYRVAFQESGARPDYPPVQAVNEAAAGAYMLGTTHWNEFASKAGVKPVSSAAEISERSLQEQTQVAVALWKERAWRYWGSVYADSEHAEWVAHTGSGEGSYAVDANTMNMIGIGVKGSGKPSPSNGEASSDPTSDCSGKSTSSDTKGNDSNKNNNSSNSNNNNVDLNLSPEEEATWDKIAECEATGNWAANTGNGFSGGLQFTPSTWESFGGKEFAEEAWQATREQQITVAKKVQAAQGWGAWPACTAKLGLS